MKRTYCFAFLFTLFEISSFAQNITKAEYFIDTDAGAGNNTEIVLEEFSSNQEITFNADLSQVAPGLHRIYCRVADEDNCWSIASRIPIKVLEKTDHKNLAYGEYFIDEDPGFGAATNLSVTSSGNNANISFKLDLKNQKEGLHILSVRFKDESGNWTQTANQPFFIIDSDDIVKIEQFEYYFSNTNGDSPSYIFENFDPASTIELSETDFLANTATLEYNQEYTLNIRALGSNGKYSPYSTINFTFTELDVTGFDELQSESIFSFYPNPVKDFIYIKTENEKNARIAKYAIYDQSGRQAMKGKLNEPQINVTSLNTGQYYLVIYSEDQVCSKKIIKQ